MALWVCVALLSMVGLGANVYKYQSGEPLKWASTIAEITCLVAAVLFAPIPTGVYKDGGTRTYSALTYKIVDWNRLTADSIYEAAKIYWFPNNFKSIDDLWTYEEQYVVHSFTATILELDSNSALVAPLEEEEERRSADLIHVGIAGFDDIGAEVGSCVVIYYTGGIMESYPAQIHAVKWEMAN
jgi:hypothetical protein